MPTVKSVKPKSAKPTKAVKAESLQDSMVEVPVGQGAETKKRGRVKKQPPTREEALKMLSETTSELKMIIQDLKEDESKVLPLGLKKVPELIKETLKNLEEDLEDIVEKSNEISELPVGEVVQ